MTDADWTPSTQQKALVLDVLNERSGFNEKDRSVLLGLLDLEAADASSRNVVARLKDQGQHEAEAILAHFPRPAPAAPVPAGAGAPPVGGAFPGQAAAGAGGVTGFARRPVPGFGASVSPTGYVTKRGTSLVSPTRSSASVPLTSPPKFIGTDDDEIFDFDGKLTAMGQKTAALHLCVRRKNPTAVLCAKVFSSPGAADREIDADAALKAAYRENVPGLVRFIWTTNGHARHRVQPILIMPYYHMSLDWFRVQLLHGRAPLAATVARVAMGLAHGLSRLHALNLAHCDVKPSNIMLQEDGWPVLVDFGAVTAFGRPPTELSTKWIVSDNDSKTTNLQKLASAALDLHCLASSIYHFVTHADPGTLQYYEWPDVHKGKRVAKCVWDGREGSASDLLAALIALNDEMHLLPPEEVQAKLGIPPNAAPA